MRIRHKRKLDDMLKEMQEGCPDGSYFWMLRFHLNRHPLRRRGVRYCYYRRYEATYQYIKEEVGRRFLVPLRMVKLMGANVSSTKGSP